jgi:hypothetical protein
VTVKSSVTMVFNDSIAIERFSEICSVLNHVSFSTSWLFAFLTITNTDELVKSQQTDGTVKSSRCKARTSSKAVRRHLEE